MWAAELRGPTCPGAVQPLGLRLTHPCLLWACEALGYRAGQVTSQHLEAGPTLLCMGWRHLPRAQEEASTTSRVGSPPHSSGAGGGQESSVLGAEGVHPRPQALGWPPWGACVQCQGMSVRSLTPILSSSLVSDSIRKLPWPLSLQEEIQTPPGLTPNPPLVLGAVGESQAEGSWLPVRY